MSLTQIASLELQDLIGRGSCGAVYQAIGAGSQSPCAVKVFSSMSINRKLLAIALRGLQTMPEHPGLLRPKSFEFDQSPYYCAMPLIGFTAQDDKGQKSWQTPTLEVCCGKVSADEAWRYIYEVCDSMAWLHKHNLVHCNLKPRSVLMEDDRASATKITDVLQGWIGGVHHFEPTDHFMYMPPEQAEHPDQITVHGTQWDVYAFGVLAYRLLTGHFPRAESVYLDQLNKVRNSSGTPGEIDNRAIIEAVRGQQEISWANPPATKWEARRREILERCLKLDLAQRWPDLRDVMREFEKLEADFLLEDAREKIDLEKGRQRRKVLMLRASAAVLGVALVAASVYGVATLRRALGAENQTARKENQRVNEVTTLENAITSLTVQNAQAREAQRLADANLQLSQEAVDTFLNQLLQLPTGLGLHAEISDKQLKDALAFYETERAQLEQSNDLLPERARNYFNSAQLLMRQQQRDEAREFFEKARTTLVQLLEKEPAHVDVHRREALLGRTCRWLGTLKSDAGSRSQAATLFREAVKSLSPAVDAEPTNRSTRFEAATAWYELGKRLRRDGQIKECVNALNQVSNLLNPGVLKNEEFTAAEKFLVARGQTEQALALRDEGKTQEALKALFDALETMVKLVEVSNNQEQVLALAELYIEFGELASGNLGANDAKDSQSEAQTILLEILRTHPEWADARFLLARNHGNLAMLERDAGSSSEAIRKQGTAIELLSTLTGENPGNMRFAGELLRQQNQQAQLLCDLGRAKEAIPLAQKAVDKLDELLKGEKADLDELDRKNCGVLLAQLYGILGHSGEITKDANLARTSFTKASEQWETLKTRHGSDDTITEGLSWSKDRLSKIK